MLLGMLGLSGCGPRYGATPRIQPEALWAPLPYHIINIQGVTVAYVDSGGEGEPLLLIHGLSSYTGFWERQIPAFASQGYRVISLDLPGYGASSRPDAPCDPPWYASVVADFMDALELPATTVFGHSMGGQIALTLALTQPERVRRLVLSAPAGFERFSRGERDWMRQFWHEGRALEADEDTVRANFAMNFARWDDGVERLVEERVRMAGTAAFEGTSVAVARSVVGMIDHPVLDRLGEIRTPTLVIFGEDDRLIPNPVFHGGRTATFAKQGVAAIPGAELVMLSGAGHMVHHDQPEEFNETVLDWLHK